MKFLDLIQPFSPLQHNSLDPEIAQITTDSREVQPGCCFIATRGSAADGHRYIQSALDKGATAIIAETETDLPEGISFARFENTRNIVGSLASHFFGHPSKKLFICGITGTNGKTSITYMSEAMLKATGKKPGVIGTVNYRYDDIVQDAPNTTPGPITFQKLLSDMVQHGVSHLFVEISSHALDQRRADGIELDCALFTNLSRDHLDYHETMGRYAEAKRRLFVPLLEKSAKLHKTAVINADDPVADSLIVGFSGRVLRTSLKDDWRADLRCTHNVVTIKGSLAELEINGKTYTLRSPLIGDYNVSNLLQVLGIGLACRLDPDDAIAGLETLQVIPGRLERVADPNGLHIFVDYSHTPDALKNALGVLQQLKVGRLIVVMGCGGDRDKGKRPLMGKVAGELADIAVITSDNPRTEDPVEILEQIVPGVRKSGLQEGNPYDPAAMKRNSFVVIENRRKAIRFAVNAGRTGDVILIAGKGHETYQIIGTVKHDFDDRKEAAEALALKYENTEGSP